MTLKTKNKMRTISVLTITTILTVSLIAAYPLMQAYAGGPPPPKDLSTWTAENYDKVGNFTAGAFVDANWDLSAGDTVVTQTEQGQPTVYISNFTAQNMKHTVIWNTTSDDDDFIGFALGYELGDNSSLTADYLLVDWKQENQTFNFDNRTGAPINLCPGGKAIEGLALSRVTGIPDPDEFWQHVECLPSSGNVTEIVRATNLGDIGYTIATDVTFDIIFTSNGITVIVDGIPEIAQSGDFSGITGNFTFYDFSQPDANFKDVTMMNLEGCSSGFWKNESFKRGAVEWGNTAYLNSTLWNDVPFADIGDLKVKGPNIIGDTSDPALLDALNAKGGIPNSFAREAVAALLNASDPNIMYPLTVAQVIILVDAAVTDGDAAMENLRAVLFDLNHARCPV